MQRHLWKCSTGLRARHNGSETWEALCLPAVGTECGLRACQGEEGREVALFALGVCCELAAHSGLGLLYSLCRLVLWEALRWGRRIYLLCKAAVTRKHQFLMSCFSKRLSGAMFAEGACFYEDAVITPSNSFATVTSGAAFAGPYGVSLRSYFEGMRTLHGRSLRKGNSHCGLRRKWAWPDVQRRCKVVEQCLVFMIMTRRQAAGLQYSPGGRRWRCAYVTFLKMPSVCIACVHGKLSWLGVGERHLYVVGLCHSMLMSKCGPHFDAFKVVTREPVSASSRAACTIGARASWDGENAARYLRIPVACRGRLEVTHFEKTEKKFEAAGWDALWCVLVVLSPR
ncbi:hypothetical protein Efla_007545 [Eimeria flavescens]